MNQEVLLDCGAVNSTPTYCVWFGPVGNPMPEFATGCPVARAEFDAAMQRFGRGQTLYMLRTVKLALTPDADKNPPIRYDKIMRPRGRMFRVWMRASLKNEKPYSLIVQSDFPDNIAPVVVRWMMAHGRTDHIQKVTELPLHFEDESGEECGDLDFRVNRPLPYNAKLVGETETAGDFSVWKYASVFDDRKGA